MPGRKFNTPAYRYGFNGKEKMDDINSIEGAYDDFGARIYDSRLGRWFSPDPLESKLPGISTYAFSYNSPIVFNDPTGESGRLTVDHEHRTITMEQTVFLYGKSVVVGQTANMMNEVMKNDVGPATRYVKDKDGNEWTVTIKVTYVDTYAKTIDNIVESNHLEVNQADNVPAKFLYIPTYEKGDYFLRIDQGIFKKDEFGHSAPGSSGGSAGQGSNAQTWLHEPWHGFGFDDAPGTNIFKDDGNSTKEDDYYKNGKHDVMQGGGATGDWEVKNRHYTDLLDYVIKNLKNDMNQRPIEIHDLSKKRGKLTEKEEKKINSRVRFQ